MLAISVLKQNMEEGGGHAHDTLESPALLMRGPLTGLNIIHKHTHGTNSSNNSKLVEAGMGNDSRNITRHVIAGFVVAFAQPLPDGETAAAARQGGRGETCTIVCLEA